MFSFFNINKKMLEGVGKKQFSIKNGKYHGSYLWYFDNGNLWIKEHYVDGKKHGLYVSRFKNGKVESKGTYKNDSPEGPWVFYTKDGTLRKTPHEKNNYEGTGTYKDDKKISD